MPGKFLIDTNVAIPFLGGENSVVERILALDTLYISVITFGELIYGARHSRSVDDNLARIDRLYELTTVLDVDSRTSRIYGQIKAGLRKIGRPIPDNDSWIAAIAVQRSLTLITRDAHFSEIDNLHLEHW